MEVDVAAAFGSLLKTRDLTGVVAVLTAGAPAASVWDVCDLLDVDVDHMAGPAGNDALRAAIGLAGGIDKPATVEPQSRQVPRHRYAG